MKDRFLKKVFNDLKGTVTEGKREVRNRKDRGREGGRCRGFGGEIL